MCHPDLTPSHGLDIRPVFCEESNHQAGCDYGIYRYVLFDIAVHWKGEEIGHIYCSNSVSYMPFLERPLVPRGYLFYKWRNRLLTLIKML